MSGGGAAVRGRRGPASGGRKRRAERGREQGKGRAQGGVCAGGGEGNGSVRISFPRHLRLTPQPPREGAALSGEGGGGKPPRSR